MKDLSELVDQYMDENKLYRNEGRQGVENLCLLIRALGYKDDLNYYGQFNRSGLGGALGDLFEFLEDNPGAITAMIEWISDSKVKEWEDSLREQLTEEEEEEEEKEEGE